MTDKKVAREAQLRWVDIAKTKPCPAFEAQRELNEARVDHLVSQFDLEQMGTPTVNIRGDVAWIIDGNHRIEALKRLGFEDDKVECWTYEGLSLEEEAERFLKLNDTLTVDTLTKFRVGVRAGRPEEVAINKIVTDLGLNVSRNRSQPGRIMAVEALRRTFRDAGPEGLRRTLTIIRDAYGDPGFESLVIAGMGMVIARYGDLVDDEWTTKRLAGLHGGVKGLVQQGYVYYERTGQRKAACVGAAIVDVVNKGLSRSQKLTGWWS